MQITGLPDEADDDTPITLLLTKEEPVNYDPEPKTEDPTVQVINGKLDLFLRYLTYQKKTLSDEKIFKYLFSQ